MINATLALLGCVGGDWIILGGVALRERRAESSDCVMASLEGCDILVIVSCWVSAVYQGETRQVV